MRGFLLAAVLGCALTLGGCAGAGKEFLPIQSTARLTMADGAISRPAFFHMPTSQPATIDIAAAILDVRRASAELPVLRHAVVLCGLVLFGLTLVNAILLVALWSALARLRGDLSRAAHANPAAAVQVAVALPLEAIRYCGCGAPIAARSRTGRCRTCARAARQRAA